jgi:hypothetical protein
MIYITINKKGGVGKSTFSNQILSAYLFDKTGVKTKLVEVDDENNDNATFSKTEIMECSIIPTTLIKTIDEIFFDSEDTIIDIGGNKTATIFLEEIRRIQEFENVIWFVPIGAGEQDNLNGLETFNEIKELDANAKVVFVLSKAHTSDLEWEFLNFFGNEFLSTKFAIMKQVKNAEFLVIKANSIISNARYFQKTVFDLSKNEIDFRQKAKDEQDKQKRRKLVFMNRVKNEAIEYVEYLKRDVFTKLDALLNQKG